MTTYQLPERTYYADPYYTADQMHQAFTAGAASRDSEVEALTLALQTERAAANRFAKDTVHWIEKHDKLLAEIEALRADALRYELVMYQFQWTNPGSNPDTEPSMLEWKEVAPQWNQTVQQKVDELLSYRYNDKPCYRVRPLYAAIAAEGKTP